MKTRQSDRKIKREKLEERIKLFINKKMQNNGSNNLKKINNNKNKKFSSTSKDDLKHKNNNKGKNKKKILNKNNINTHEKKNINISSLSTQVQMGNEQNNNYNNNNKKDNKTTAIPIKKEIGKFVEPRFKLKAFQKLAPKFYN